MRDGIVVPQLRQEECIDIMVNVLSSMELHPNAAKGYLRTGMTVDLDGLQDLECCSQGGSGGTLANRPNWTVRMSNASSGHAR